METGAAEPMLDQLLGWAAVNSGSRNLAGLERMAELLADAFAAFPAYPPGESPAGRGGRPGGRKELSSSMGGTFI